MRVQNACEKDIVAIPANVINVLADVSTNVLVDVTKERNSEYAARYIFNAGPTAVYYAFGQDCNPFDGSYHGILAVNQQLDCSNTCQRVAVYAKGGITAIAPTEFRRVDNFKHVNIIQGNLP